MDHEKLAQKIKAAAEQRSSVLAKLERCAGHEEFMRKRTPKSSRPVLKRA